MESIVPLSVISFYFQHHSTLREILRPELVVEEATSSEKQKSTEGVEETKKEKTEIDYSRGDRKMPAEDDVPLGR